MANPARPPVLVQQAGIQSPTPFQYFMAQNAAFRESDLVTVKTTGTIVTPTPTGALALIPGPVQSAVTLATTASANAPAATYYVITTYAATGTESLPGQELLINVPFGFVPTVTVAVAGAPAGATSYNAYVGLYTSGEAKQNAAIVALGVVTTLTSPLTNSIGLNRAVTGQSTGISGLAVADSLAVFATGIGGSFTAGGLNQLFGTWDNPPPLGGPTAIQGMVVKLQNGQMLEMSLLQPFYQSLVGTAAGISIDAATGYFQVDNTQTACLTIVGSAIGVTTQTPAMNGAFGDGGIGIGGSRVNVVFNAAAVN